MSRQQQTIHAAVLHGIGQAPRYEPFPVPVPGEGQAVVSVTAAALKPSDRLMANGVHYAPTRFPQIVGLDGVGRLPDGTRVAFFAPQPPYGGMAEQALVRRGMWLPVPDGIDDVIAAAVTNPGMAARIRYIQVGITAGEMAALPAITLRIAPVQLFGSGLGGSAPLADAAAAYDSLLRQVAAGEISLDVDPVPLATVEQAWPHAGSARRIVFVP